MKKKTLIIVILILFFIGVKSVFAENVIFSSAEDLDGVAYLKHDGFYYHFRNAKAIRNITTNNIAYCIEPFATLVDGSSYTGYIEYNNIFNLSKEQWDRLKLLSYYGYGYKNHTDQKWITITQILIWRTVDPNHSFNWIDNVYDRNIIYPYQDEIREIENLVLYHNNIPNISTTITMSINETLELVDDTYILNNFKIKDSNVDAEIVNNKLIIRASDSGNKRITLISDDDLLDTNVAFFYKSGTQSVIERGRLDPVEFNIDIEVQSGSIKIIKVDSETKDKNPRGEASLIGAEYLVSDESDNIVGKIVIGDNNEGVLENLAFGKYKIKELTAGTGYYLDEEEYFVDITKDNLNIKIILENSVIESKLKIVKYYGNKEEYNSSTMRFESGIKFEFYDKFNHLIYTAITDDTGSVEVSLPYGEYVVKQITTTSNYEKVDDFNVGVNEDSNISIELVLYDLEIDVPNAYIEDDNVIFDVILISILVFLLGVVYFVGNV